MGISRFQNFRVSTNAVGHDALSKPTCRQRMAATVEPHSVGAGHALSVVVGRSAMASKILETVAPGIYKVKTGFRVKVSVGSRKLGGLSDERTYPPETGTKEMKAWQHQRRAELERELMRPARGTLEADIPGC